MRVSGSLTNVLRSPTAFFIRLAWRNLWRNKRRSLIAVASVFFAVFLAIGTSSLKSGQYDYMIHSAVSFYTGHIQIHARSFWEKRSLNETMVLDSSFMRKAESLKHVVSVAPRFETVALVSHGDFTRVSSLIGIDPIRENAMTSLGKRFVRGSELTSWHEGAVVGEGLARLLDVDIGDSLIVYGQGFQGITAAGMVRIAAIVKFPNEQLDNNMTYLPLSESQALFSAPERVTAIALLLDSDHALEQVTASIRGSVGQDKEVMTWREMMPEVLQAITVSKGGTAIMLLILYTVVGFGIFGTIMMMTAERTKEFGISVALGMKRWRLISVTMIESIIVSMLGAVAGIAASIPLVLYFYSYPIRLGGDYAKAMMAYGMEPILPFAADPVIFCIQGIVVFALGVLSSLYPMMILRRIDPARAMRG